VFWSGHQIPGLLMLFLMGGAVLLLVTELKKEKPIENG
jgi:hypothetical protein